MDNNIKICVGLMLCFFWSCSKYNVIGRYHDKKSYNSLSINKDSTYRYSYKLGFKYEYSEGRWEKGIGKRFLLNSGFQKKAISITAKETTSNDFEKDYVKLNVNTSIPPNEQTYYECLIFADTKLVSKLPCDSLNNIKISNRFRELLFKITADIRIPSRFLDTLTSEKYIKKEGVENQIDAFLNFNDSLFNYRVFKNEPVSMVRRGVIYKQRLMKRIKKVYP